MSYRFKLIYPDGEEEVSDEVFTTEEAAKEAALYESQGGEIMALMGDRDEDIIDGTCSYEIIED